jgi:hypothetical protein
VAIFAFGLCFGWLGYGYDIIGFLLSGIFSWEE